MKIVVLDGFLVTRGDLDFAPLEEFGELAVYGYTPPEQVVSRLAGAGAAFLNRTPISREILSACPQLRFIGVTGTGVNMIDLAAAAQKGVAVCNVPGYSTAAVAQMTMALLLDIACSVSLLNGYLHAGRWQIPEDKQIASTRLFELSGKTMGLVGFGAIGRQTAHLAKAFGMRTIYSRRRPLPEDTPAAGYRPLEELLEQSDVVSLHCPLTEKTRGMIDETALSHMKPGAVLLNTARGGLIDSAAVARALESGRLYAAGLDVLDEEPPKKGHPLIGHSRCVITPHVAWAPAETRRRLIEACAENLRAFLAGRPQNLQRP
ncbi:MAG: D-2-hydroxyacid dehydrogenase [Provencibacterium sp.]|jgi:glycerate dehydrogenase|nr:D-2-hydroxyacid dehydrogenase [Provencibacterium sp.]